jgi:hypothetical protein
MSDYAPTGLLYPDLFVAADLTTPERCALLPISSRLKNGRVGSQSNRKVGFVAHRLNVGTALAAAAPTAIPEVAPNDRTGSRRAAVTTGR